MFFLMLRRPPRSTRTYTLFPYTTLFRSLDDAPTRGDQHAAQQLARRRLVLDDQHMADRPPGPHLVDQHMQAFAVDRLRHEARGAEGIALPALVEDGHHDDRDGRESRIGLEALQDVPAVQARSEKRRVGQECVSTCRTRWSS